MRADLGNHSHHVRKIARAILDADDSRALDRKSLDRIYIDRRSKQRDVVKRYIDVHAVGNLFEIGEDTSGASR